MSLSQTNKNVLALIIALVALLGTRIWNNEAPKGIGNRSCDAKCLINVNTSTMQLNCCHFKDSLT